MSYDLNRVSSEFTRVCNNAGVDVRIPIKLNGRLRKCLGRVTYLWSDKSGKYEPECVEFSKLLLASATDKSIHDVVLHEASHYIAAVRSGEMHGHDDYFKAICLEIGTDNYEPTTSVERTVDDTEVYKYFVKCKSCGKICGKYHRQGKVLKNLENYKCQYCGHGTLVAIKNF